MLNKIIVMGRLTADPILKDTASGGGRVTFTLAVERDYKDKSSGQRDTDFIDVVNFRNSDFIAKHFVKGQLASVEGRLQMRKWEDKDGNKRLSAEILAENIYFAGPRPDASVSTYNGSEYQAGVYEPPTQNDRRGSIEAAKEAIARFNDAKNASATNSYSEIVDNDSDLPF